jgi:hypothetical protein
MNILAKTCMCALVFSAITASLPQAVYARDPGVNQPGRAGNVGRDPGINQPGPAGNVGGPGPGVDPGINQPGAAGNVGRDPGVNQPGAAGNRPGVRR